MSDMSDVNMYCVPWHASAGVPSLTRIALVPCGCSLGTVTSGKSAKRLFSAFTHHSVMRADRSCFDESLAAGAAFSAVLGLASSAADELKDSFSFLLGGVFCGSVDLTRLYWL